MPKNAPTVLVSSTFYDLKQVRDDLRRFISDDLGYRPLLSEHHSFPVDPDVNTIENCRRRVEQDTDVLVLLIGGRYGYVDKNTAKSVTNLEYLAARAKGIPVYAFVEKSVLAVSRVAKANVGADFSAAGVDDVRVFDFIEKVRSEDGVWMGEFERAHDVIETLRVQLAYLMNDGLQWLQRVRGHDPEAVSGLGPNALRIALERPEAWEYRLFAQALSDAVATHSEARYMQKRGLTLGFGDRVSEDEFVAWMHAQLGDLKRIVLALRDLFDTTLHEALGPPGMPGDPRLITFAARAGGQAYGDMIAWCQRMRRANIDERYNPMIQAMSGFAENMMGRLEAMGPDMLHRIEDALSAPVDDPRRHLVFEFLLDLNVGRFEEEMRRVGVPFNP